MSEYPKTEDLIFTNGSWKAHCNTKKEWSVIADSGNLRVTIAKIVPGMYIRKDEERGNARLIAQAPRLLNQVSLMGKDLANLMNKVADLEMQLDTLLNALKPWE